MRNCVGIDIAKKQFDIKDIRYPAFFHFWPKSVQKRPVTLDRPDFIYLYYLTGYWPVT
jgi:hypothetical protein